MVLPEGRVVRSVEDIRDYYVDHLHSSESKVRAVEYGAGTAAERLVYYAQSLAFDHAGLRFLMPGR